MRKTTIAELTNALISAKHLAEDLEIQAAEKDARIEELEEENLALRETIASLQDRSQDGDDEHQEWCNRMAGEG